MSAEIIQFGRVRRDRAGSVDPEIARATPWSSYRQDLRVAIADDDPAYELFNSYQRAQLAYQTAMKALARHTGYNVRQVAKSCKAAGVPKNKTDAGGRCNSCPTAMRIVNHMKTLLSYTSGETDDTCVLPAPDKTAS